MADHRRIVPLFLQKEGGLSNISSDTSAAANPAPCTITYKGRTASNWHTNKGVTWLTFSSLAPKLGYTASCSNFERMPAEIWGKIFKEGFWDKWNLDKMDSQMIAETVVWWHWGSGEGGARNSFKNYLQSKGINAQSNAEITQALSRLSKQMGEKNLFMELVDWRIKFYESLNKPQFIRGWKNAQAKFVDFVERYEKYAAHPKEAKEFLKRELQAGSISPEEYDSAIRYINAKSGKAMTRNIIPLSLSLVGVGLISYALISISLNKK